jgi:hypothetical protein
MVSTEARGTEPTWVWSRTSTREREPGRWSGRVLKLGAIKGRVKRLRLEHGWGEHGVRSPKSR